MTLLTRKWEITLTVLAIWCFAVIAVGGAYYIEPDVSNDAIYYAEVITEALKQNFFVVKEPPLFLYITYWIMKLFHTPLFFTGIAINVFFFASSACCFFLLLRTWTEQNEMALWGTALFIFQPMLLEYSHDFLREGVYIFNTVVFLYALLCAIKYESDRYWCIAGSFAILAFFSRYEGGELILFGCIALLFFSRKGSSSSWLRKNLFWWGGVAGTLLLLFCLNMPMSFLQNIVTHLIHHAKSV